MVRVSPLTATPVLTPVYTAGQAVVTMASATASGGTPGAVIWYTTDGSSPTIGGGTSALYLSPVTLTSNVTVKAVAQQFGLSVSGVSAPLTLAIAAAPHLEETFPASSIATGSSAMGTVSLSAAVTSSTTVTLTSPAPNALSFGGSAAVASTTVTLTVVQPVATFTMYGLSAGTAVISASGAGVGWATAALRSRSIAARSVSVSKAPIYGFSAVNGQAFNNVSQPAPAENDAYQVSLAIRRGLRHPW